MLETCDACGAQYLPKPGESQCPHCGAAFSEDDEGWDDLEEGWEGEEGASGEVQPGEAGTPSGEPGQGPRRRRTRSRGKRRARPATGAEAAPAQGQQPRPKKKRRPSAATTSEKKAARKKLPAWLLPVAVLALALIVGVLALVASRGK